MKALITGASSGIGRDMARYLSTKGYDLILVARRIEPMEELKKELNTNVQIIQLDISTKENCYELYNKTKNENIDILINNAGFGIFGEFEEVDLEKEINLINTNITAVHILTKLYIKDMIKRDSGNILNVASIAGFMPGPLMSSYYASKNYVVALSRAIQKELKKKKSNVKLSVLCPGPVTTNFNNVAGVKFNLKSITSEYATKYGIDEMLKGKKVILPTFQIKLVKFFTKIAPDSLILEASYRTQVRKRDQ